MQLECVQINPKQEANSSVIWLHGLGADGYDFVDIVPQLQLPATLNTRFVFPHAPFRNVTLNGGLRMRAWFDIYGLGQNYAEDTAGIMVASKEISELIARELARGISSKKIVLAGFSQGGALALETGLRLDKSLAGILVLSGVLLGQDRLLQEKNSANQNTPIMMMHGEHDSVISLAWARWSFDYLQQNGFRAKWQTYNMEHTVCMQEILQISSWLQEVLA